MKQVLLLLLLGFCTALPISAQIPDVRNAVDRKVEEAYAAMRAKHRAEEAAQAKQRQVEEQIESTVQLGVRKNQQQTKKLESAYGVNDLEEMVGPKPARKASGGVITKSRADAPWKRKNGGKASGQATTAEMEELKAIANGSQRIATHLKNGGSVENADVANKHLWQNHAMGKQMEEKIVSSNPKVEEAVDGALKNAARIDSVKKAARADSLKKVAAALKDTIADGVNSGKTPSGLDKIGMIAARNQVAADFLRKGAAPEVETALMKKGYVDVPAKDVRNLRAAGNTHGLKVRRLKNEYYRISFAMDVLQGISKTILKKGKFPAKK